MVKKDFLQTVLDLMNKRSDDLAQQIADNNAAMNKRVDGVVSDIASIKKQQDTVLRRHERAIVRLEKAGTIKPGKKLALPANWTSVIYLLALASVMFLAIIARILHVDLGGLLP